MRFEKIETEATLANRRLYRQYILAIWVEHWQNLQFCLLYSTNNPKHKKMEFSGAMIFKDMFRSEAMIEAIKRLYNNLDGQN